MSDYFSELKNDCTFKKEKSEKEENTGFYLGEYGGGKKTMSKSKLSIEDIENMSEPVLTPKQVAQVLNCSEKNLRQQLKDDPFLFGFPVTIIYCPKGYTKISIPRIPFIRYLTFGAANID